MCHDRVTWPIRGGSQVEPFLTHIDRGGDRLPIYRADPPTNEPAAGIVLVHDIHGPNAFYQDMTARLAEQGYLVALPDLFAWLEPLANDTREAKLARADALDFDRCLEDMLATIRWLRDDPRAAGLVGVIGFCMGGTLAMLAAGFIGGPDAAVSFYGFPAGRASWPKRPIDEAASVQAPLLLIVGDQDHGVGMDNMARYEEALDAANKDYESITYQGVGHAFMTFDPEAETYPQAADAWAATLQFLDEHLAHD